MSTTLHERTSATVISHDLYFGPTESQLEMITRLKRKQAQYTELLSENPLFKAAVRTWVEAEHDDSETFAALQMFHSELVAETEDMTDEEKAQNPDRNLHKMVKLRLEIAVLKMEIEASERVTGINLDQYLAA